MIRLPLLPGAFVLAVAAAPAGMAALPTLPALREPPAPPAAARAELAPMELAQNLESTIVAPEFGRLPGFGSYPSRRPGLWEIRNAASDNLGLPPTHFCVGEKTDTPDNHLDRVAGEKGSCSIGPFRREGITWVAESVCKEARSVVVSQSIASGDFQTQYRIDTLVFYSPPLANNKREDKEAIVARYLGSCGAGQRPGDLVVPGMGVLNMGDGTLRQGPRQ